ncbi:CaiB/BaiF CoA transferase family protein [Actinophytocola gossypii]|uniref:CoA transferase n=1 Tax=Actinophytocola gossypii TaxID=2812003 RepID=A0ABT2J7C9_9PSEU|nr:CaiB/BaiF CoA-transferase family protein [Actinophytocola gossypii]MCT2583519.1 CoA transferase [Actinophytocola gossypii]
MTGPLAGIRVVELAGLAPGPFAAMVLADLGADVVRVDRPGTTPDPTDLLARNRTVVAADLKDPDTRDRVLRLVDRADVLVEGFRPGVTERLGLGPDVCLARNPGLVYGRMTGWGQDGPLAPTAGHDINYISLAGALHPIGPAGAPPVPPLNLVGDFGGGGLLLALGCLAALLERRHSGAGQVVDAAMVDGAGLLTTHLHMLLAQGMWPGERGRNLLDGGAPFYRAYPTSDGRHVGVGAIEPAFYAALLDGLGLADAGLPDQLDRDRWPELEAAFATAFASRTRDEWERVFAGTDACVSPVLTPAEATTHPHQAHRGGFTTVAGVPQPAPAPRFGRSATGIPTPVARATEDTLASWRLSTEDVERLVDEGGDP